MKVLAREPHRKTPEDLLREVQFEEAAETHGRLKIFLGYASGVGKSFRMLDEARRRRSRGQDIVVAAMQNSIPGDVQEILDKLDIIPPQRIGGSVVIDMDRLLRRRPAVCVIDGLAYDNPPGSRNPTRWQDAQELLDSGISIIASVNIQYVAELRDEVESITGKHVTEVVPVSFIKSAAEIEIVDAPADEASGGTFEDSAETVQRQQRLSKLREIALVLAADVVDHQLLEYLKRYGIGQQFGTQERILVCITPRANVSEMIQTARTIAEKFHGQLIVTYVRQAEISASDQAALDEKLAIARSAGACVEILEGDDPVTAILDFAHSHDITQLFIGHSQRSSLWSKMWGNAVEKFIRRSRGMDVRVFPQ